MTDALISLIRAVPIGIAHDSFLGDPVRADWVVIQAVAVTAAVFLIWGVVKLWDNINDGFDLDFWSKSWAWSFALAILSTGLVFAKNVQNWHDALQHADIGGASFLDVAIRINMELWAVYALISWFHRRYKWKANRTDAANQTATATAVAVATGAVIPVAVVAVSLSDERAPVVASVVGGVGTDPKAISVAPDTSRHGGASGPEGSTTGGAA